MKIEEDKEIKFDKIEMPPENEEKSAQPIKQAIAKPAPATDPYRHLRLQIGETRRKLSDAKTRLEKLKAKIRRWEKEEKQLTRTYESLSKTSL